MVLPGLAMATVGAGRSCPNCSTAVKEGDIICIRCGTNLLTGQRIVAEAEREAPKRSLSGVLPILGIGAAAAVVIAVLAALVFYLLQDPVADARRLAQGGNVLEAQNILQEHIERRPDDAEAQFLLGKLYWRGQQHSNAATAFQRAAELAPENAEAGLFAAVALGRGGSATAKNNQIAALRRMLEHHPEHEEARYLLALALGSTGELNEFSALVNAVSQSAWSPKYQQFHGIAEALRGNVAEASQQVRSALADSDSSDARAALGAISQLEGDPESAKRLLREAIDQESSVTPLLRAQLGLQLMADGDFEGALTHLQAATAADMTPPQTRFYYGLALQSVGLDTEALTQYERVVSGNLPLAAEASGQMALLYLQQGNLQKAEETLRAATQGGAGSPKLHTLRGQLHAQQGSFAEAQQSLRRAIQMDENYAPARLENGLLFVTRGMLDDGLRELEAYLDLVETGGPAAAEIEVLVNQLRQTIDNPAGAPAERASVNLRGGGAS